MNQFEWMNDVAVCRTAPAKPGILIILVRLVTFIMSGEKKIISVPPWFYEKVGYRSCRICQTTTCVYVFVYIGCYLVTVKTNTRSQYKHRQDCIKQLALLISVHCPRGDPVGISQTHLLTSFQFWVSFGHIHHDIHDIHDIHPFLWWHPSPCAGCGWEGGEGL